MLDKASQEMNDEIAFVLQAQQLTLNLLRPGASCPDSWATYDEFMRKSRRPEERRLYCHGQGYDMVARPLVRRDESMAIRANMNIVVHPVYVTATTYGWVCDNFLIGANGVSGKLHRYRQQIVEIE